MADFQTTMANAQDLSEKEQKKAGAPIGGDMDEKHKKFVKELSDMILSNKIDPNRSQTFINADVYANIDDALRAKVDMTVPSMAILLRHIVDFYLSKETPDACPQLATMIDELEQMKNRIEKDADVFVF